MSLLISPNALTELISIGKHEQFELLADIPERYPELKSGLRLSSTTGKQLLDRLSSNEIVHLCKALTIGENIHSSWMYGSVSPVIWLYHVLDSRTDWKRVEVTNWLLSHTNNPYVPFTNHGAVSIEEYEQVKRRLSDQKKANQQFEESRAAAGKEKKTLAANSALANAIRRGDRTAVAAMLAKGADPDFKSSENLTAREMAQEVGRADWLKYTPIK